MSYNLYLIPLLPFLGAAVLILFGRSFRREVVYSIATGAIGLAFLVAATAFFTVLPEARESGGLRDVAWTWISSGSLQVDLAFRMDALSGVLTLIITFIGTLIHIYSMGYMSHEPDYARFFAYLNLFCGAMLVLVLGDSLPVLFIGWEGVGLCSYLLIGFWYLETANANAGKKAFITNRIGDFGFLLGMFLLFQAVGSLSLTEIIEAAKSAAGGGGPLMRPLSLLGYSQPVAFWAALCLFIGATGKSAQLPLYVWLPDAMAGPTPVSALIHAATMVTAGVYMIARLNALFVLVPTVMAIVAIVGALTALFAALIGFAQNDFKKVLAYSTVSQLGFMFVGVGTGAFGNGVFHLGTHAFFKAGLFLCAGSVMHAMSGSGDITKMGGLRKLTPWTWGVFVVCWLAIAGVPPFSGFFSKDSIIAGAFATHAFGDMHWVGPAVGSILLVAALCTAFYMSRLYFLVFEGESRADAETLKHVHESPLEMVGPLVVLAVGAGLGGFLGFPDAVGELVGLPKSNILAEWLEPAVGAELHVPHSLEYGLMAGSTVIAVVGILAAAVFYYGGYRKPAHAFANAVPGLVSFARNKFLVDELYGFLIIRPLRALSKGLFWAIDRVAIDQLLVGGVALIVDVAGRISRVFQVGDVQRYLAAFAIGLGAIFYVAIQPPAPSELKVKVTGKLAEVDAAPAGSSSGASRLLYEFDFQSDGSAERKGAKAVESFTYDGAGWYDVTVTIRDPLWDSKTTLTKKVQIK